MLEMHSAPKCAEIFYGVQQQFSIRCCYCNLRMQDYDKFQTHFQQMHRELMEMAALKLCDDEELEVDFEMTMGIGLAESGSDVMPKVKNLKASQKYNLKEEPGNGVRRSEETIEEEEDEEEIPLAVLKEALESKSERILCTESPKAAKEELAPKSKPSNEQLTCPICGLLKNNKYNLQSHINSHTGARPYKCERCGNHYTNSGNLWKHTELVHNGNKTHSCAQCNKKFQFKSQVKRHEMRVHLKIRQHACDLCTSAYFSKKDLDEHKTQQHATCSVLVIDGLQANVPNYVCEHCGKSFVKYSSMWAHRRVHMDDKRHVCKLCQKPMHTAYHLREHMNTHTGQRPHECNICKKAFQQKKFLRDHARIHSGIKAYACNICGKKFTQAAGLYCHAKTHRQI